MAVTSLTDLRVKVGFHEFNDQNVSHTSLAYRVLLPGHESA